MDYILLSLIPKRSFSVLEFEKIKELVNKLLVIEFVDDESIFWDENGDLIFHPPVNKRDRSYWINNLNSRLNNKNWEFITGKVI